MFEEEAGGKRPAPLPEVSGPQERVQRRTMEHLADLTPMVQILNDPVPLMVGQLVEVFKCLDLMVLEQVIAQDRIPHRFVDRRQSQIAEQLVEVRPCRLPPSSSSRVPSRSFTIQFRVVVGGSGGGGLQGFLPAQNSTAPVSQQIVDIPVRSAGLQGFRPGQVSTPSAPLPRSADEAFQVFFRNFSPISKKCAVRWEVECWSRRALELMDARAYEPGEFLSEEEEEEDPDRWIDEYGRTCWRSCAVPGRWCLLGTGMDVDIFWDESELGLVGFLGGRGGGFRSNDHAARVPAVLLVHDSRGASDSVQPRVPDVPVARRACRV